VFLCIPDAKIFFFVFVPHRRMFGFRILDPTFGPSSSSLSCERPTSSMLALAPSC
jgi:hypothetical protein